MTRLSDMLDASGSPDADGASRASGVGSAAHQPANVPLSPEAVQRINEMGKRVAAAFGEIVGILMRAPQYRHAFLADLEWLVLPPLATGQFAFAEARHKESGLSTPVAVILWACVSDEVDARLSSSLGGQLRLKPAEWKCGDNAWLVEAVGEGRAVRALIDQTLAGPLKGKGIKVVSRGADGRPALQVLRPGDGAGMTDAVAAGARGVAGAGHA